MIFFLAGCSGVEENPAGPEGIKPAEVVINADAEAETLTAPPGKVYSSFHFGPTSDFVASQPPFFPSQIQSEPQVLTFTTFTTSSSNPLPEGQVIVLDPVLPGDLGTWRVGDNRGGHSRTFSIVSSPFLPRGFPFPDDGFAARNTVAAVSDGFGDLSFIKNYTLPPHSDPARVTLFFDGGFSVVDPNPFISESLIYTHFYRNGVFLNARVIGVNHRAKGDTGYPPQSRKPTPNPFSGPININLGFLTQPPDLVVVTVYARMHGSSGQAVTHFDNFGLVIVPDLKILQPQNLAQFNFGQEINFQGEAVSGITNFRWVSDRDGEFSQGLTATVSTLLVGTHTITLKGNVGSPTGSEVVSDPIQIGVQQSVDEIRIFRLTVNGRIPITGPDAAQQPFKVSSLRSLTDLKAIGYKNGQEVTFSTPVTWALIGENIDRAIQPIRGKILDTVTNQGNLTQPRGTDRKIADLDNGKFSVPSSDTVSLTCWLSGPFNLEVKFPQGNIQTQIQIEAKQPVVYLNLRTVDASIGIAEKLIPFQVQLADQIWGKENLIQVKVQNEGLTNNRSFDQNASTGEVLLRQLHPFIGGGRIDLNNPLVLDARADNFFSKIFTGEGKIFQTRQVFELSKQDRAPFPTINVYFSDFLMRVLEKGGKYNLNSNLPGITISFDTFFNTGQFNYEKVTQGELTPLSTNEAGIHIRVFPEFQSIILDDEFIQRHKVVLAHEMGHLLLDIGDEHVNFVKSRFNVMYRELQGLKDEEYILEPEQFIAALNLNKIKPQERVWVVEE